MCSCCREESFSNPFFITSLRSTKAEFKFLHTDNKLGGKSYSRLSTSLHYGFFFFGFILFCFLYFNFSLQIPVVGLLMVLRRVLLINVHKVSSFYSIFSEEIGSEIISLLFLWTVSLFFFLYILCDIYNFANILGFGDLLTVLI